MRALGAVAVVVCIVVAWTGRVAAVARAGEVTCCSYVVYETEAEGPVTAPLVRFRSLGRVADATAWISSDAVRLRDRGALLRAPSPSCRRVSLKEVVCNDIAEGDPTGRGRWVQLVGSGARDRLVVEPFRGVGDVFVELHGRGGADTLIGGLGVGRRGLVSMSPRAGRDRLLLSRTGPRFDDRLRVDFGALTLRLWGAPDAAGLALEFVVEGVGDAPTKALAHGRTTVARQGHQRVLLRLTADGAAYFRASAAGRSTPWSDLRVRIAGRDVSAQLWLWPDENTWMADPRRGATVLQSPAPDVEAVALGPDGTIAATAGCCGSDVSVLVRPPGGRWQRTPMGGELNDPVLVADGRGRQLVVGWRERGGIPALIRRERSVEGRWSPTTVIASAHGLHDENPGKPAVAVDSVGRAIVSWRVHDRQYAAVRDTAGRWQRPARLGRASPSPAYREHDGDPAAVSLGADGTGWVAWESQSGRLSVASFAGSRFDPARPIGARGAHRPVIAARNDGAAVVAWVGRPTEEAIDYEEAPVYAALVPRSGRPRPPTRLSDRRSGASEAFVTAASANAAVIVWQPAGGGDTRYASLGADGRVTPSRTLSGGFVDSGFFGLRPLVTRDDGTPLLLADGPGSPTIYAWRTSGGFRPVFVTPPGEDVYSVGAGAGLAVNGRRLLAAWQQPEAPDGSDSREVVLVLDPGPA